MESVPNVLYTQYFLQKFYPNRLTGASKVTVLDQGHIGRFFSPSWLGDSNQRPFWVTGPTFLTARLPAALYREYQYQVDVQGYEVILKTAAARKSLQ